MLRKIHREPEPSGPVESMHEAFDHGPREELEVADPGEHRRIEEAGGGRGGHLHP
jgi:hypothetical protein